jgi:hypothetical protein
MSKVKTCAAYIIIVHTNTSKVPDYVCNMSSIKHVSLHKKSYEHGTEAKQRSFNDPLISSQINFNCTEQRLSNGIKIVPAAGQYK